MKFVFLLLALLSQPAYSGVKEVGNGGDIVVCRNDKQEITSTELLDFYEARVFNNQTIDLGPATLARDEKVKLVFERLRALNSIRADRYEAYFKTFFDEADFVSGVKLRPIPDAQEIALPVGCTIEQAVIQITPSIAMPKRYTFDKDLWDKLDINNQAGLLMHEVIFRENIEANIRNSINVRYVNRLLASGDVLKLSAKQYFDIAVALPLPDWEYKGYNLAICQPALVNGDVDPCGNIAPPATSYSKNQDGTESFQLMGGFATPSWAPWVNGLKQMAVLPDGSTVEILGPLEFNLLHDTVEKVTPYDSAEFSFGKYGLQTVGNWACSGPLQKALWQCGIGAKPNEWSSLEFYPDGKLKEAFLSFALESSQKDVPVPPCDAGLVHFDELGTVTSCRLYAAYHISGDGYDLVVAGNYSSNPSGLEVETVFDGWIAIGDKKYYPSQITDYTNQGGGQYAVFLLADSPNHQGQFIPTLDGGHLMPANTSLSVENAIFTKFTLSPDLNTYGIPYNVPWGGTLPVSQVEYEKAAPKDGGAYYIIDLHLTVDSQLPDENGNPAIFPMGSIIYLTPPPNQRVRSCVAKFTAEDVAIPCYGKPISQNGTGK